MSVAVLSGNRNFEGRVHPFARAAYLASPALVIAYAIAGNIGCDLTRQPVGRDDGGKAVYLRELWPTAKEVAAVLGACLTPELYRASYANLFEGAAEWRALKGEPSERFAWRDDSTFLRMPPFFENLPAVPQALQDFTGMRPLAILGDRSEEHTSELQSH